MTLRVVQWATGSVGKAAIDASTKHPDLDLVGCWVHSKDKHGSDVGEIVGSAPLEPFEVEIKGNPNTFVTVTGWQAETIEAGLLANPGIVAAAAHCVNSVPYVCAAAPGIVTSLELPLVAGRADPKFSS
jgi:hypothetical protein